jgi:hypothetical protein
VAYPTNHGFDEMKEFAAYCAGVYSYPNVWFGNVALVAAKDIGQVTVTYVATSTSTTLPRTGGGAEAGQADRRGIASKIGSSASAELNTRRRGLLSGTP